MLLVAAFAAITLAQTTSSNAASSAATNSPPPMTAELAAIVECNTTQLDDGQITLTSNQRAEQCEEALDLQAGTMLQVTTADATEMCETTSCRAALQELYNFLPNCRYELWGLQYSAKRLLEYCGITPTNTTSAGRSRSSAGWSVTSSSASFADVGATEAPSTAAGESTPAAASSDATTRMALTTFLMAVFGIITATVA
ncbi:uncharacterized protein CCR75_007274 [Bremia lactucae]|uniref:Elicitin n=1 Tax=Bremia lactucae TaxID=4779 RepID=A0A976FE51_BRELC|nr:hypothetical protein CCR75_007274 [Bremia lactucae]